MTVVKLRGKMISYKLTELAYRKKLQARENVIKRVFFLSYELISYKLTVWHC